jgi:hypothetical protein
LRFISLVFLDAFIVPSKFQSSSVDDKLSLFSFFLL